MLSNHNPNHCNMQSSKKGKFCISWSDKFSRKKYKCYKHVIIPGESQHPQWILGLEGYLNYIYLTARKHLLRYILKCVLHVWQMTVLTAHILYFQGLLLCLLCVTTFVIPVPHLDRYLRLWLLLAPQSGAHSKGGFRDFHPIHYSCETHSVSLNFRHNVLSKV